MRAAAAAVLLLLPAQDPAPAPAGVRYEVDCTTASEGIVGVTMTVEGPSADPVSVSLPSWAPGSYRLQNFWRNVEGLAAASPEGKALPVGHPDEQTWSVTTAGAGSFTVSYRIRLGRANQGAGWIDLIGPAVYLYVRGRTEVPHSAALRLPEGWSVATGLEKRDGRYVAPDYDTFIDAPSLAGVFELLEFEESGTRFQLANVGPPPDRDDFGLAFEAGSLRISDVVAGGPAGKAGLRRGDVVRKADGRGVIAFDEIARRVPALHREQRIALEVERDGAAREAAVILPPRIDGERLVAVHRALVKPPIRMFGGRAPFERYVFLNHFKAGPGGAGLEHLNSCHIVFPYETVRQHPERIASLNSHEFFHAWNVKRIRPAELGPFDYTKAVPSRHLWFCEGVTSYYGDLGLARARVWTERQYFDHLAGEIDQVQGTAERKARSIEDFSEKVWTRPTNFYYRKGEVLGLLLDLRIRVRTDNRRSLDDVMRLLYDTWVKGPAAEGRGPIGTGFPGDGILRALNEVSGADFGDFYARYIRGTEELPYEEVFAPAGLAFSRTIRQVDLGVPLRGRTVGRVEEGSPAAAAGFREGDRIVAIGGREVDGLSLKGGLQELAVGEEVEVRVRRGSPAEEVVLRVRPVWRERPGISLERAGNPTETQRAILDSWLGRKAY